MPKLKATLKASIATIRATAAAAKHMSTAHALYPSDVDEFAAVLASGAAKRLIRVYSSDGFVPDSYRNRCEVQYVEATLNEDGKWKVCTGWTGAQRSSGRGSLIVVQ